MARRPKSYKLITSNTPAYVLAKLRAADIEDLRELHEHVTKRVTTNLSKLQSKGLQYSPAYRSLTRKMESGRITPLAGVTPTLQRGRKDERTQLVQDIYAYSGFLKSKTHTVTEAARWDAATNKRMGSTYANATEKQKTGFWRVYEEYRAQIGSFAGLSSDEIQKNAWEWWSSNSYKYKTEGRVSEFYEQFIAPKYDNAEKLNNFMNLFG